MSHLGSEASELKLAANQLTEYNELKEQVGAKTATVRQQMEQKQQEVQKDQQKQTEQQEHNVISSSSSRKSRART